MFRQSVKKWEALLKGRQIENFSIGSRCRCFKATVPTSLICQATGASRSVQTTKVMVAISSRKRRKGSAVFGMEMSIATVCPN